MNARREYPEGPIPGVGAVVLRELQGRSKVVLVRRRFEPMAGSWSLPGGAIEAGETASEACAREVLEETALTIRVLGEVDTVDLIVRDQADRVQFHYLIVEMLCGITGGEIRAGDDASDAVWADVQGVLERGDFALTPRTCTVIRKALDMNEDLG